MTFYIIYKLYNPNIINYVYIGQTKLNLTNQTNDDNLQLEIKKQLTKRFKQHVYKSKKNNK